MFGVVAAKASYKTAAAGLQQAKDYAEMLGLKFVPTPDALWQRYCAARGIQDQAADRLLTPCNYAVGKDERYYHQIAINRTVEATSWQSCGWRSTLTRS